MSATARERISRIVNGEHQNHPFDFINNLMFYSFPVDKEQESVRRLLAQARVAATAAEIASQNLKTVEETGSMSNGLAAYRQVLKDKAKALERSPDGLMTTQDIKYQIAHSELMNNVVLPNRIKNQRSGDDLERLFPDHAAVVVADFEAPIRETQSNNALSQSATFQDPIYESYWLPRFYRGYGQALGGDHAWSRYANPEEITGDIIQCGLADHLRDGLPAGKDYFIVDRKDGQPVTLSDRAWETAKHIVDVTEHGFKTDFAVAALIARFQIDDWLNGPDHGPLDMKKVSPVLASRSAEDKARMTELKQLMLPYLADKCLNWFPFEKDPSLKAYVEKNVIPASGDFNSADTSQFLDKIFSYHPKGGANDFLHSQYSFKIDDPVNDNNLSAGFAAASRTVKRRDTGGEHFSDKVQLFDVKKQLFSKLSMWEQAADSFVASALEGIRLPDTAATAAFFAAHRKGGTIAQAWADEKGVKWLKEAQNASDNARDKNGFAKAVMNKNAKLYGEQQAEIPGLPAAKLRGIKQVLSTLDFDDINDTVEANREFVAAEGPSRLSSDAVLALEMEWFDRNAQSLILAKDWQNHPHNVQMAVRAVQHATGLIDRIYEGGNHRMEIFVLDPDQKDPNKKLQKQNLYDLIATLGKQVEFGLSQNPPVPDHEAYVACAQLLEIADKLGDPGRMNYARDMNTQTGKVNKQEIIAWNKVDSDFYRFWENDPAKQADLSATKDGAATSLRDRLRGLLLEKGISFFSQQDLTGLSDEYSKKWSEANGRILEQGRKSPAGSQTRNLKYGQT
jgi:hypothetical protein